MNHKFSKLILAVFILIFFFPFVNFCLAQTPPDATTGSENLLTLQVPIFDYAKASSLPEYIGKIFYYAMIVIVPLAILMILIGGIQWISSAGQPQKITAAKGRIIQAVSGLLLALLSYVFLSFVGITQLSMPGIQKIEPVLDSAPDQPGGPITPPPGYTASDANPTGCPTDSELQTIDQSKIKVTGSPTHTDSKLRPITLAKLYAAQEAAKKQNCTLSVSSAHRTMAQQQWFYNCYTTNSCNSGSEAARPSCNAPHITGGAVDVSGCGSKLKSIMFSVGWTKFSGEAWHFEYGTKQWSLHPGAEY